MEEIKLYKNTQTKAHQIGELFTGQWGLTPYNSNSGSPYYDGYVEKETEFVLPDGYKVAEDKTGGLQIYHGQECCDLMTDKDGAPRIISKDYPTYGLKLHQTEQAVEEQKAMSDEAGKGWGKGWFAIVDYDEEKAFTQYIVYTGTNRAAVDRLYPQNDSSGPWDTQKEAEEDLDNIVAMIDFPIERVHYTSENDSLELEQNTGKIGLDEIAFRIALKMRTQIAESLQNGSLPCLPGPDGIADTTPAVNLVNGMRYHGANLLYLKDFQKRNGFPTAEYATQDDIQKSGIPIKAGESGVMISFAEQNKQTGDWENKNVRLFNAAQTARPGEFKAYAEKLDQEKEQEKQASLKNQYGDSYLPREKTEQKPGPDITCSSTEPEHYLGQYLAAVSMGGTFKTTQQQASEFSQKMGNKLYERTLKNENTDPFKLSKICREAGVQCKEIIKEIEQPQHKQDQTQQHSRHM